jgi:ankyrin repeat protein
MAHYEKVIRSAVEGKWGDVEALIIKYEEPAENYIDNYHGSILHIAVRRLEIDVIKKIILSGFNINIRDTKDRTVLHIVTERLSRSDVNPELIYSIVVLLVESGVDIDVVSSISGCSVLHNLVIDYRLNNQDMRFRIIKYLLERGANVNVYNTDPLGRQYGMTPYLSATMYGASVQVLDLLKKYGANYNHIRMTYGYQHLDSKAKPDNLFSEEQ